MNPIDPEIFKKLKKRIAETLLIDISEASRRLRDCDPSEVEKLSDFFALGYKLRGNQWRTTLQVCLPRSVISSKDPDGIIAIDPPKRASCRSFSIDSENKDPETGKRLCADTRELLSFLSNSLSGTHIEDYQPLMNLFEGNQSGEEPYSVLTQFGQRMLWLEDLLEKNILLCAKNYHRHNGLDIGHATPPKVMMAISRRKLIDFQASIEAVMETCPDSEETLLPLVSASIVVNQRIFELAHLDRSSLKARQMVVNFVSALNQIGIDELPEFAFNGGTGDVSTDDSLLKKYLTELFGYQGYCSKGRNEYFTRQMQECDIDCTVKWSKTLHEKYLKTRGSYAGSESDPEIPSMHTEFLTRVYFTLIMAAAFYGRTRVSLEMPGSENNNSDQSVFPSRGDHQQKEPPTHVWLLLTQAYGLLYFGNQGRTLRHESIDEYAEYTEFRRSCYQTLLHSAVTGRSASQIKALYDQITFEQTLPSTRLDIVS